MEFRTNSVLIVDDEPMNIRALAHILQEDYTVYAETNGKACIDAAKRLNPDLILLDIIMSEMDGFTAIQLLKQDADTKDIPVIFVTGLTDPKDEVKGFALGAADYVSKPFSPHVVLARVKHQMQILNQMRKIQKMSVTCILTGLGNRRFLNEKLEQEWERAKRTSTPLSFIIMDIDNFKCFNDTRGHINGDTALQSVAAAIKSETTRATDIAARWGGEEFVVLLPNTDLEGAEVVAENIRHAIQQTPILLDDDTITYVTASFGIHSTIPKLEDTYTLTKFISDADQALYAAKSQGKNRTSFAN